MLSDDRELVLERVRAALSRRAPEQRAVTTGSPRQLPVLETRAWLPAVPTGRDAMIEVFAENCRELRASFVLVNSALEAADWLIETRAAEAWTRIATHGDGWIRDVVTRTGCAELRTDRPYGTAELECCDAAITGCDALIAQTGSVLLTSATAGGRAASVLAPHHVVLSRVEQVVADLPTAFAQLEARYASGFPSFACLVTGPSRTADIEKTIVFGAHGPRRLSVVCVREPS